MEIKHLEEKIEALRIFLNAAAVNSTCAVVLEISEQLNVLINEH